MIVPLSQVAQAGGVFTLTGVQQLRTVMKYSPWAAGSWARQLGWFLAARRSRCHGAADTAPPLLRVRAVTTDHWHRAPVSDGQSDTRSRDTNKYIQWPFHSYYRSNKSTFLSPSTLNQERGIHFRVPCQNLVQLRGFFQLSSRLLDL